MKTRDVLPKARRDVSDAEADSYARVGGGPVQFTRPTPAKRKETPEQQKPKGEQ